MKPEIPPVLEYKPPPRHAVGHSLYFREIESGPRATLLDPPRRPFATRVLDNTSQCQTGLHSHPHFWFSRKALSAESCSGVRFLNGGITRSEERRVGKECRSR